MEQFVIEQIKAGLRYVPSSLIKSVFQKKPVAAAETVKSKVGGYICGVCHPTENYEQIHEANIEWIRIDIPIPVDKEGNETESYINFKAKCRRFKDNGFKIMSVTPYPCQFLEIGIDPVKDEKRVKDVAVFLANDLTGLVDAFQVTNEMGIPRFTIPLTMDEAARFIGIQLEAIYPIRGNIIIGYNSAGPQADLHVRMRPYLKYCDYVGIDIYVGCFAGVGGFMWFFDALLRYLTTFTKKPIILQEFGYIGLGKAKTKQEKRAILQKYGANSEKDAVTNIDSFVSRLPEKMSQHIKYIAPTGEKQANFIFKSDFKNHLYCELPGNTKIPGYDHSPEGQAKFFSKILPRLYKKGYMCGSIIYCYSDSNKCYVCSQDECPTETKWGLIDLSGKEKPSFYAVKEEFGKILSENKAKYYV